MSILSRLDRNRRSKFRSGVRGRSTRLCNGRSVGPISRKCEHQVNTPKSLIPKDLNREEVKENKRDLITKTYPDPEYWWIFENI